MLNNEDKKVLSNISDHVRYIDITIKEMVKCIYAWFEGNKDKEIDALNQTKVAESDANKIKTKVMTRVSEDQGSLHRTDFLRLILNLDIIADFAEGVASRITRIKFGCNKELQAKIKPLTEAILKMGDVFKQTINSILENPAKTPQYCDMIDKIEEETDVAYRDLEAYMYASDMDIKQVLQLDSPMHQIEEAGDLCQRAADHIRIIIATL